MNPAAIPWIMVSPPWIKAASVWIKKARWNPRPADKARQDDAYRPEIDNPPAGPHIPVRAADGKDGKKDDEKNHVSPAEMFGRNGFTEKSGAAYEEQKKKENGNAEPYMLYADNP